MNDLLGNPALQGGVAPFLAALLAVVIVIWLLRADRFAGIAITVAFITAVALTVGWSFESMNATRKLSLLGIGAGVLLLAAEAARLAPRPALRTAMAVAAAAATLWLLLGVLRQMAPVAAALAAAAGALFVAALVDSGQGAPRNSLQSGATALVLGLAGGALALLGASAVLALMCISVGAGAGAVLLVQMISGKRLATAWTLTWPASAVVGPVAVLSVLTGGVRWYTVLPLLAVPWATRWLPVARHPVWLETILAALAAAVPAALALVLAWAGSGAA